MSLTLLIHSYTAHCTILTFPLINNRGEVICVMAKKWIISLIGGVLLILAAVLVFTGQRIYESFQETTSYPLSQDWFFENSEVIAYVEVLKVSRKIERSTQLSPPGIWRTFPRQRVKVKFLRVFKGAKELEDTTGTVIKGRAHFYLNKEERLVLYLRKGIWRYHTVSNFQGRTGVSSVIPYINSLEKDKGSGLVVEVLNKGDLKDSEMHVLQGRQKSPVILDSETYRDNLVKKEKIDEFGIAEIPLEPGSYTVLIELDGDLYSFNRLVEGHYPYVILEENTWEGLYFDVEGELW